MFKYTAENPMPEEIRKQISDSNKGRKPHNRIEFSAEQIQIILNPNRSLLSLGKQFNVTAKVIARIRRENKKI